MRSWWANKLTTRSILFSFSMYQIVSLYISFYQSRECPGPFIVVSPWLTVSITGQQMFARTLWRSKPLFCVPFWSATRITRMQSWTIRFPHRHREARIITLLDPAVVNLVTRTHETDETHWISFAAASRAVLPVYERDGFSFCTLEWILAVPKTPWRHSSAEVNEASNNWKCASWQEAESAE